MGLCRQIKQQTTKTNRVAKPTRISIGVNVCKFFLFCDRKWSMKFFLTIVPVGVLRTAAFSGLSWKSALRSQFFRDVVIISVISHFASSDPCKLFFLSTEHSPQTTISKGSAYQCRSGDFIGDWAWQELLPLSNIVSIFGKISLAGFSEEEITWHFTHPT